MPAFNPFTPCANTVRRMGQIFRRDAHSRSSSGASTASSVTPPLTPTTPSYNTNTFYFSGPITEKRSPSPTHGMGTMSSFNTGYFSDASGSDANTPYRHRGRTQMTKTLSSNTNSGVNSPTMTTSVSYSSVGHNAKRNSVSSNHSYRSLTSLHGGMPFAIEDEIREPATERLRRRLTRMARKMKRKMNAAGRKLRRNSSSSSSSSTESATGNRAGSSWDAVRSPSGSQRCPVSYSQYGTDTDVMQCIATVDCRTQVKDISDPWMDLEWQF